MLQDASFLISLVMKSILRDAIIRGLFAYFGSG